jgi:tetratricopeptide (TPR) repeat protein
MKISLYSIRRKEEEQPEGFMEVASEADSITICSIGRLSELYGPRGYENFSHLEYKTPAVSMADVKNYCLSKVSIDTDYCIFIEMFEKLNTGWRDRIEELLTPYHTDLPINLIKSKDASGNPETILNQTRIHTRFGYTWIYPFYEVLECTTKNFRSIEVFNPIEIFSPAEKENVGIQNLISYGGEDQLLLYYIGREYYYLGMYVLALTTLDKAKASPINWTEAQVSKCLKFMAFSAYGIGDYTKSESYYLQYLSYRTCTVEAWYDVALFYFNRKLYNLSLSYSLRCIDLAETSSKKDKLLVEDLSCWTWRPHDLAANCSYHLGDLVGYKFHSNKAVENNPKDLRLISNRSDSLFS